MTEIPKAQKFTARVAKHEVLGSKFHWIELLLENPAKIEFTAGQYISLKVAEDKHNKYSIATPPRINDRVVIIVDISPKGKGTDYVFRTKVGDKAEFVGPLGRFNIQDDGAKKLLFVATGSGISPLRSMIHDQLEKGEKRPIELYFGLRYEEDIFLVEELKQLAEKHPNFSFHICLSQPGETWEGKQGHVTGHIDDDISDWENWSAYLCGNGAMIASVRDLLLRRGVAKERIYKEQFFEIPAPKTRPPHYGFKD